MLQNVRERFTGPFAMVIIGSIAVALTISFVKQGSLTGGSTFAARVNGEEIPLVDFRQVAQAQILQQEEVSRAEIAPEDRRKLEENVLEGMVRNRVVAQYVKREGYRVSDAVVAEDIRAIPVFQVDGKFSNDGYRAALASQGVSPDVFEEERRAALQIKQLESGVLESSFFTPAEYRRFVVLEGEKRRASFAILDPQQLGANLAIGEDELKAYYDGHPDRFESQESVALDYVEAKLSDFGPDPSVSEAELRATYDADPNRFVTAEQRRARHILVAIDKDTDDAAAAKLAGDIRSRLGSGEDFAALARQYSDDPGSAQAGGELGWAGKGTYVEPFEKALYALKVSEISPPVKTTFGYHVIQLEEVRPGSRRPFEEVRDELAKEASTKGTQDKFFALTEKMDDAALENPGSLDPVAAASGLPVHHIDVFTRAGAEPFAGNRAVIDAAFGASVLEGENSALIEAGDGHAVILRVAEHRPVKLRPFEDVRTDVEKAVRTEKLAALAAERGRSVIERARGGADFGALASEAGAAVVSPSQALARGSQDAPPELLAAIFRAPRPSGTPVFDGLSLPDGRFGIFRVDEVIPGNPDEIPVEQRDARKGMLARQSGIAEVTALAVDLRKEADVVVAPTLFDQTDNL